LFAILPCRIAIVFVAVYHFGIFIAVIRRTLCCPPASFRTSWFQDAAPVARWPPAHLPTCRFINVSKIHPASETSALRSHSLKEKKAFIKREI